MNTNPYKRMLFSLVIGGLLLAGWFSCLSADLQNARAGANANDWFVTVEGSGTACTQASPCDLATALDQSSDGDTIYVAQGDYTGSGGAVITVTHSVALYGGWDGAASGAVRRDPDQYTTTLDGEDARRGVYISGAITPTLDGFTITRGNASHAGIDSGYGGGIYSNGANPIITHNTITHNAAYTSTTNWGYGGGMYIYGVYSTASMTVIDDNLIADNVAGAAYRGQGGGLHLGYSKAIISNNTFRDNLAGNATNGIGGGLSLYNSPAILSGNLILGNQATPTGDGFGGGLYSHFGDLTLDGNIVISNTAQYGAITLEGNLTVTLTNNIIAQNPAGGVFVRGNASSPVSGILAHNTIVQNDQEGVYAGWYNSGYSTLTLTNNIIAGHTVGIYAHPDPNPNVVTATHTLFYGNDEDTSGATITSADAITGQAPLFANPIRRNYHLRPGSPAIDAGVIVPWLTTDVDGDPRPWPAGGDYDIGADEAHWQWVYLPLIR